MADSVCSVLVVVLNASIYICINWTLTKLYDTSVLEPPFYKSGQKHREIKLLAQHHTARVHTQAESGFRVHTFNSRQALLCLGFLQYDHIPPYPTRLANISSFKTNLAFLPLWIFFLPPMRQNTSFYCVWKERWEHRQVAKLLSCLLALPLTLWHLLLVSIGIKTTVLELLNVTRPHNIHWHRVCLSIKLWKPMPDFLGVK